jgi:hypothetical protein
MIKADKVRATKSCCGAVNGSKDDQAAVPGSRKSARKTMFLNLHGCVPRFVTAGGPSVDKLMPGDQILSINGEDVAR